MEGFTSSLLGAHGDPSVIDLSEASRLRVWHVFSGEHAKEWMLQLQTETRLEERSILLFGRTILQPRLVGWAGQHPYTYSGQTLEPRTMGPKLMELLEVTNHISKVTFNHALLNLYRNGVDSMGMHSDDEPELGPQPLIASWSFGATRRFSFAEKKGKKRLNLELQSGQLLLMEGKTQLEFRHGLPKTKTPTEPRLNVTFRQVRPCHRSPGT